MMCETSTAAFYQPRVTPGPGELFTWVPPKIHRLRGTAAPSLVDTARTEDGPIVERVRAEYQQNHNLERNDS